MAILSLFFLRLKMQAHTKYLIERSPLYQLSSKSKLFNLLVLENQLLKNPKHVKELGKFLIEINNASTFKKFVTANNYRVFTDKDSGRTIQDPKPALKLIHKKLANLLSHIITPDYLHSGVKTKSYVTNATSHKQTPQFALKMDIHKFYQSCQKEFIFKAFKYDFKMPDDIAWLMADLVSYNGFIPTGSPVSQLIAFYTYKRTFDEINLLAKKQDIIFSLYVDDLSFSSTKEIPNNIESLVYQELKKVNLPIKSKKTKRYSNPKQYKIITGCAISPDGSLKVPNKLRKDIIEGYGRLNNQVLNNAEIKSLNGKIQAARQIEPDIFPKFHPRRTISRWINKTPVTK